MKLKKLIFSILLTSIYVLTINAQNNNAIEQKLVQTYNLFSTASQQDEKNDEIKTLFRTDLQDALLNHFDLKYPFEQLGEKITITSSEDKKLRIFSWDNFNGGTWHDFQSIFQYQETPNSPLKIYSEKIPETEATSSEEKLLYSDVSWYKIESIATATHPNQYLIFGYGTHGGGNDFFTLEVIRLEVGNFSICPDCINGQSTFTTFKSRNDDQAPQYDPTTKKVQIKEYKEDPKTGNYISSGKIISLKFNDKKSVFIVDKSAKK